MEVSDHAPHRTTYRQNNSWMAHEIPVEWLPVRCETKWLSGPIGWDCRACARSVCQEPPRHQGSIYRAAVRLDKNLERFSIHSYASFCRVCLGCCAVNFWNPGRDLWITLYTHTHAHIYIYRMSQEECARLRKSVPYVKVYRYNPKHLCPKLNGYGDNGQRKVWAS